MYCMVKYLRISSYIRKPFLIYDFATAPLWISLYMRKILFNFYQCTRITKMPQLIVFLYFTCRANNEHLFAMLRKSESANSDPATDFRRKRILVSHNAGYRIKNSEYYADSKFVEMDSKMVIEESYGHKTMFFLSFLEFAIFANSFSYNFCSKHFSTQINEILRFLYSLQCF